MDALSEGQIRKRRLLDAHHVSRVVTGFLDGIIGWAQPWLLMMLELWCQEVLDRPTSPFLSLQGSNPKEGEAAGPQRPLAGHGLCASA